MLEVEYKAHVPARDDIVARLQRLGAIEHAPRHERDRYYAHPTRDFAATDEALRIRHTTTNGGATTRLTYKGPRRPGPTRTREEVEVRIDGDIARVLEALGFRLAGAVEKRRRLFRIGAVSVTLDDVAGLGRFAEVERLVPDGATPDAAREEVLDLVRRLGLGAEEPRSYLELVLERGVSSSGGTRSDDP